MVKAFEARTKPYRRTEMWLYLPEEARPPPAAAQKLTATLMREIYLTFALWTSVISIGMWLLAAFFSYLDWGVDRPLSGGRLSPAAACPPARRGRARRAPRPPAP